jgi:alkanesulfonate monooxygenase SsuD/methylene tetrahydromethanopterin reductase-like flavin-dependent oxidoreductase (luciferase family)
MFETIAKYADGWAIGSWYLPSIKEYKQKMERLKLYCLKAEREFESLEKAIGVGCIIAENKTKLLEKIRRLKPAEVHVERYEATQKLICGTLEECIEKLGKYVDIGVDHFMMEFPDITTLEAVHLFGEHVIPYFK